MPIWPQARLGELLIKSKDWVELDPEVLYQEVTVKLWGKGVVLRRETTGAEIAASSRLRVHAGQFILSRIDARNGASGLVPSTLDGAVVSTDFPVFNVNEERLLPTFLGWLSRTAIFVDKCQSASEGTTNRVRLKEDRFLQCEIPLPPLSEQRRIVAKIDALAAKLAEARSLRHQAAEEAEAVVHSCMTRLAYEAAWEMKRLPDVAVINPSRTGKVKLAPSDMVSFVPMKAVDDITGTIAAPETRCFHEVSKGYTWFTDGDIIFARITPCMQNGKAALAKNLVNGVAFGSTEFHVIRPGEDVCGEWIYHLVRHKTFREDAAEHFKGTAGQQRVPQSFLQDKLIPVPPLSEQRRIVAYLDGLQAQVDTLNKLQAATAAELDALLPSILDKAFKGEL